MTYNAGNGYTYVITPDERCRVYHLGKFKWQSDPMPTRKAAKECAEGFIKTIQQGEITLDVQDASVDFAHTVRY